MASTSDYDGEAMHSELEDAPRRILDIDGDFTLQNVTAEDGSLLSFKICDFCRYPKDQRKGKMAPLPIKTLRAVRPVQNPEAIMRSRQLMGNNWHGVWTGTPFHPPTDPSGAPLHPADVFAARYIGTIIPYRWAQRFCLRRRFAAPASEDLKTMCIYTDGTNLIDQTTTTAAEPGVAFAFQRVADSNQLGRRPQYPGVPLSNPAELRAILAALTYRDWWVEGWRRVVLVTNSEYVAANATGGLRDWAERGWRTAAERTVANRDIWEELSRVMGMYADAGCEVSFWGVARELGARAGRVAEATAEKRAGTGVT